MMPNAEFRPIESIWGHLAGSPGLNPRTPSSSTPRCANCWRAEVKRCRTCDTSGSPRATTRCSPWTVLTGLNAQGAQMRAELREALAEFSHDDEMRVGIVTGAGRAFSAGADLREMAEGGGSTRASQTEEERIEAYRGNQPFGRNPKPFIAAVNGLAIGAGMERAADCDIRIASTDAYFGLFEVKRGILANYAINTCHG